MKLRIAIAAFLTITLVAIGCGNKEVAPVSSVRVLSTNQMTALPPGHPPISGNSATELPPGHPNVDMSSQMLPPGSVPDTGAPKWKVPADWKPGRVSAMRKGSFVVSSSDGQNADIAVTAFPGDVGGLLSNVNRWRSQIGLPPAKPDEMEKLTTTIEVDGVKSTVVDIAADKPAEGAKNPVRMIVVTVQRDGLSWFFKMTGDAPLVASQKDAFLSFVKSVKF